MDNKSGKLLIVRHGESEWNKEGLFTGKTDVHLTKNGFRVSEKIGELICDIKINKVFTSMQSRAIETEVCIMGGSRHCVSETVQYSSLLNERDYGDYTGMDKDQIKKMIGEDNFKSLRRKWDYPVKNGETLKMVSGRALPFFLNDILPIINNGENVLVVSHGNTIRSLMKYIENISDDDIEDIEMPFNEIFIYDLDKEGHSLNKEIRKVGDKKHTETTSAVRSSVQIIATMGPSCDTDIVIDEMFKSGMDAVRFNFSWSSEEQTRNRIKIIREVSNENNADILIIGDLEGNRIQNKEGHTYEVGLIKAVTGKDKQYIKFSVENNLDYVSVSFVGSASDIVDCRNEIKKLNGKLKIIAKIERKLAVENIDEIIEVADAIMIARGDLGNEVPLEEIPFIQDDIINKCKIAGKPVITATQMLYTMKDNPYPTRAEATDVVNAVMKGSDAVMLSEETAIGKYPIRAVYIMEHFALEAEGHLKNSKFNKL